MDDAIILALPENDSRYAKLLEREQDIESRFPDVLDWLEGSGPLSLSAEEHAGLVEHLELTAEKEDLERIAIYYAGHKDCFEYLRKIGVIK